AAHDPIAGSIGDGDRRTSDSETGSRNQVFERFLQPVGQTKVPTVFFVLMVLDVLFLQVWSATSLSTMSTRSIVGGTYGRRGAPSLLSMGLGSFHPDRVDQLAGPEGLGAAVIDVAPVVHWFLEIAVLEQGPARTRRAVAGDSAGITASRSGLFEIHDALEERVPTLLERALPEVVADRRHHHARGQSAVGIDVEAVQACSALEHVLTAAGIDSLPRLVHHVLIRLAEIVGLGVERSVERHDLGGRHPHSGRRHALTSLDLPEVDVRVVAKALTELALDPRRDVQELVVIRGRHHALEPDLDAALAEELDPPQAAFEGRHLGDGVIRSRRDAIERDLDEARRILSEQVGRPLGDHRAVPVAPY